MHQGIKVSEPRVLTAAAWVRLQPGPVSALYIFSPSSTITENGLVNTHYQYNDKFN